MMCAFLVQLAVLLQPAVMLVSLPSRGFVALGTLVSDMPSDADAACMLSSSRVL